MTDLSVCVDYLDCMGCGTCPSLMDKPTKFEIFDNRTGVTLFTFEHTNNDMKDAFNCVMIANPHLTSEDICIDEV